MDTLSIDSKCMDEWDGRAGEDFIKLMKLGMVSVSQ